MLIENDFRIHTLLMHKSRFSEMTNVFFFVIKEGDHFRAS